MTDAIMTGLKQVNAGARWPYCRACGGPTKPGSRYCPTCRSYLSTGRPPRPPAPTARDLHLLVLRLARRVALLESDASFAGWGWQREFHDLFERVAIVEGRQP